MIDAGIVVGYWAGVLHWWEGISLGLVIALLFSVQSGVSLLSTYLWIVRTDEASGPVRLAGGSADPRELTRVPEVG